MQRGRRDDTIDLAHRQDFAPLTDAQVRACLHAGRDGGVAFEDGGGVIWALE